MIRSVYQKVMNGRKTKLMARYIGTAFGTVAFHAGRFLKAGESVEAQGCRATVRRLRNHRIEQVQFERLPPADEPPAEAGYGEGFA